MKRYTQTLLFALACATACSCDHGEKPILSPLSGVNAPTVQGMENAAGEELDQPAVAQPTEGEPEGGPDIPPVVTSPVVDPPSEGPSRIAEIQRGDIPTGAKVSLSGVVASPQTIHGFFLSDGIGGPYSGIWVYAPSESHRLLNLGIGDAVTLSAQVAEYAKDEESQQTVTELVVRAGDSLVVNGQQALPAPTVLQACDLVDPEIAEHYEGVVIRIDNPTITAKTPEHGQFMLDDCLIVDDMFGSYHPDDIQLDAQFSAVTGPLHFAYGNFRITPRTAIDLAGYQPHYTTVIPHVRQGAIASGSVVTLNGAVVTSPPIASDADGALDQGFFVGDPAGGPFTGIRVRHAPNDGLGLKLGDVIRAQAVVHKESTGTHVQWELTLDISTVEVIDSDANLAPVMLTAETLAASKEGTPYEGLVVGLEDLTVKGIVQSHSPPTRMGCAPRFVVDHGIMIGSLFGDFIESIGIDDRFDAVMGVVQWDPVRGGYLINPRDDHDIVNHQYGECPADLCAEDLQVGDLVITEIMYNPNACPDHHCEWVEVYNASSASIFVEGLSLIEDLDALKPYGNLGAFTVEPGAHLVLAIAGHDTWGYPTFTPDTQWHGELQLNNEGDTIHLAVPDHTGQARIIDQVSYPETATLEGVALQLDPQAMDPWANDDPSRWCAASADIGETGDVGTPGHANHSCH